MNGKLEEVKEVLERPYNGSLLRLTWASSRAFSVDITPEHEVLAIKREWLPLHGRKTRTCKSVLSLFESLIKWVPAIELEEGDIIVSPKITEERQHQIDFSEYKCHEKRLGKKFFDEDMATIVGLYLAEGFCSYGEVKFSFSLKEISTACKLQEALGRIGVSSGITKKPTSMVVRAYSRELEKFLTTQFGKHANQKLLPLWCFCLPLKVTQKLLESYIEGDGWQKDEKTASIATTSPLLALGSKMLANKLGWHACVFLNSKGGEARIQGRTIKTKPCYKVEIRKDAPNKNNNRVWQDVKNFYYRLYKPQTTNYSGKVYNLETASRSYLLLSGLCVHNCKEFGWTPNQLAKQPAKTIQRFIVILNELDQQTEKEKRRAEGEARWRSK